jgi:hypothetical protein
MAILKEFSPEEARDWDDFVASRPPAVADLCRRFPPNRLYRLKDTGHRVTISSYFEGGTLKVFVGAEFNQVMFEREVFGISPDNLEECDLPEAAEPTGAAMSPEEVDDNIEALRVLIRPDLFVMGEDGKAIRKN